MNQGNEKSGSAQGAGASRQESPVLQQRIDCLRLRREYFAMVGNLDIVEALSSELRHIESWGIQSAKRSAEASGAAPNLPESFALGAALGNDLVARYFPKSPAPSSTEAR